MDFCTAKTFDRWLGVPLCFFLSVFDALKILFFRNTDVHSSSPRKILFIGLSEIGSNVLAYGAIQKAREIFPQAQLHFVIFEENKEILEILGVSAGNIFTIRNGNFWVLLKDMLRFFRSARSAGIDAVVDTELFSRFSAMLAYLSGAGVRVGFHGFAVRGLYRGRLLTRRVQFNPQRQISENFMALVKSLQGNPADQPLLKEDLSDCRGAVPCLKADPAATAVILKKLGYAGSEASRLEKIIILNPETQTRLPLRSWPALHYRELAEKLLALSDVRVVVVGTGESDPAFHIPSDRYVNWVGKTSLKELVALFHVARVLVSHDSGAVHLASLTNLKKVVLFGPETPLLYGPLGGRSRIVSRNLFCSPCFSPFNYRTSPCRDNRCLKDIAVAEVFEIVQGILKGVP